jgi:predicted peptidase
MKRNRPQPGTLLITAVLLLAAAPSNAFAQEESAFQPRTIQIEGAAYQYQVFTPIGWTPEKRWPVILFLHGSWMRGVDGKKQTEAGLGPALRKHPDRFPFIVVFPQSRPGTSWLEPAMTRLALATLDAAVKEFNGDPRRVSLTGQSLGGYGVWGIAAHHPERFTALVPVCGGVRPLKDLSREGETRYQTITRRIGKTPVWIFHGEADRTIPPASARQMFEELQQNGNQVHYTEYKGVGHPIWDRVYAEPELPGWLLAHIREP